MDCSAPSSYFWLQDTTSDLTDSHTSQRGLRVTKLGVVVGRKRGGPASFLTHNGREFASGSLLARIRHPNPRSYA